MTQAKNQIQVNATSHKPTDGRKNFTAERFELSGSVCMDSAMKPIRLGSGVSEEATPLS